jgi:hypothetical protein
MIKHSGKICSIEGCNNFLFARGYCISHYKSQYLSLKERKKISTKTTLRNRIYDRKRDLFISDKRNERKDLKIFCIFCGREINGEPDLHHGLGRDDDIMLNEDYWYLSHNECHTNEYHSKSYKDIEWWDSYLDRIKDDKEVYKKELKRMEK